MRTRARSPGAVAGTNTTRPSGAWATPSPPAASRSMATTSSALGIGPRDELATLAYPACVRPQRLLGLVLGAAAAAGAQPIGHGLPPPLRSCHERLAAADVVAVVRVERVDPGRIALRLEAALASAPPAAFEAKRSPLHPPPLASGDRALLLLRGDRPPYVLTD